MALSFNEWQGVLRQHENSEVYPDFAVRWKSKSLSFPERIGFFNVGDLGVDQIDFLQRTSMSGFNITGTTLLKSLRFPYLTGIGDATHVANFIVVNNTGLIELLVPNFETATGVITITGNTNLAAIDLSRVTAAAAITTTGNGAAIITLPSELPNTLTSFVFGGATSTGISLHNSTTLTNFTAVALQTLTGPLNLSSNTNPGLTTITLGALANATSLNFSGSTGITTLTIGSLITASGLLNFSGMTALTTLSLNALTTATGGINCSGCTLLTTPTLVALTSSAGLLNFSNSGLVTLTLTPLVTASLGINASGCPAFTTLAMSNFLPTNGTTINFNGAALTAVSVNIILARAVANAAYVSGTINCAGGTSIAPSGQGITDKATLIARGVTVLTN